MNVQIEFPGPLTCMNLVYIGKHDNSMKKTFFSGQLLESPSLQTSHKMQNNNKLQQVLQVMFNFWSYYKVTQSLQMSFLSFGNQ